MYKKVYLLFNKVINTSTSSVQSIRQAQYKAFDKLSAEHSTLLNTIQNSILRLAFSV